MARYGVELEMGNVTNEKFLATAAAVALVVGAPDAAFAAAHLYAVYHECAEGGDVLWRPSPQDRP